MSFERLVRVVEDGLRAARVFDSEITRVQGTLDSHCLIFWLADCTIVRVGWSAPLYPSAEAMLTGELCRGGIAAPEVIGVGRAGGRPWMRYRAVAGVPMHTSYQAAQAGAELLKIHRMRWLSGVSRPARRRPRRQLRFQAASAAVRSGRYRALGTVVRRAWRDERTGGKCLIHGDFRESNVLFDGDRLAGIIDWSDWDYGSEERDLGSTNPELLRPLVQGYLTARGSEGQLDMELVQGHALARVLSLHEFGVISRQATDTSIGFITEIGMGEFASHGHR